MSKTPFSKKVEILAKLWVWYKDDKSKGEVWTQFFEWNDVSLPMAYLAFADFVSIKRDKKNYIDDTWTEYCQIIGIDPDESYNDVQETFDAAKQSA